MPANSCLVTDLQFAMSCLNNASGGVVSVFVILLNDQSVDWKQINFQAVAQQCGMPTAAAANTKLWRMKKAHPLPLNGHAAGNPPTSSASPKSSAKGQGGGKKVSNKRKPAAPANEDDSGAEGSPKKCKIDVAVKKED
ncbi:hypothetical protein KC363_g1428 [Hortaea werneckii]|uniref:Myb-like DNA-binding domain-containing protein n=1 Tax=Hortaea werneckii TaxID=91943 RepID=A0A3M7FW82_HORWE|nr:hypothetical protein KC363_g1428 [Hortaea werneckii]RMY92734.1 hypothetical protein D0861_02340 [Hortaea werneckii]